MASGTDAEATTDVLLTEADSFYLVSLRPSAHAASRVIETLSETQREDVTVFWPSL